MGLIIKRAKREGLVDKMRGVHQPCMGGVQRNAATLDPECHISATNLAFNGPSPSPSEAFYSLESIV